MYSEKSKEFLCAQCFYEKQKHSGSILPIKNATELIMSENRSNREESREYLEEVENAMKVCTSNIQMIEHYGTSFKDVIRREFKELKKELDRKEKEVERVVEDLLEERLTDFTRIMKDLDYLKNSLKEYREYNK